MEKKYIQFGRNSTPWHGGFTQAEMFNLKERYNKDSYGKYCKKRKGVQSS